MVEAPTFAESFAVRLVPLSELRQHPDNPRRIEPRRRAALKTSMQKDPDMLQARPLIALPDGTVIAGNQRLDVAQELAWPTIPVITVDLDEERARDWMLRDNNSFGEWDPAMLRDLMAGHGSDKAGLEELGFTTTDIRKVLGPQGAHKEGTSPLVPAYHVRIDCTGEVHQREVLDALEGQGYDAHALLAYAPRARVNTPAAPLPDRAGTIKLTAPIKRSSRVKQVEGIFDLSPQKQDVFTLNVALPLSDQPWNIGLIVGPSGSGKTSVARHLFSTPDCRWVDSSVWDNGHSIVDDFPIDMAISDLGELLSSVGFSSPRSWLRPFHTLSNGEQFRVAIARALADHADLTICDEFTSVVDRTVAQIASSSVARAVRSRGARFVAVSCHEDILDWLQPDWVYRPATESFAWRGLQRRPAVEVIVRRCDTSFWPIFRPYHYLSHQIASGCECFVGFVRGVPVVFTSYIRAYGHPLNRVGSRGVCLPDYQGASIGTQFAHFTAGLLTGLGLTVHSVAAHPARLASNLNHPELWRMTRAPSMQAQQLEKSVADWHSVGTRGTVRLTTSFTYIGPRVQRAEAKAIYAKVLHLNEDGTLSEYDA